MKQLDGQISLFAPKAKLARKNEGEISHCTNCGCIVPGRILIGNWPKQYAYQIRFCPNCGAEFENSKQNDMDRLDGEKWKWRCEEIKI